MLVLTECAAFNDYFSTAFRLFWAPLLLSRPPPPQPICAAQSWSAWHGQQRALWHAYVNFTHKSQFWWTPGHQNDVKNTISWNIYHNWTKQKQITNNMVSYTFSWMHFSTKCIGFISIFTFCFVLFCKIKI